MGAQIGRHHLGLVGAIISFYLGGFVVIKRVQIGAAGFTPYAPKPPEPVLSASFETDSAIYTGRVRLTGNSCALSGQSPARRSGESIVRISRLAWS